MTAPELSDTARPSGELSSNRVLADCQCGGLPLLMHMVVIVGGGGDFFISSFSGRATGESALNPSVVLFNFQRFHGPARAGCRLNSLQFNFRSSELRGANPLNLERKASERATLTASPFVSFTA